VAAGLAGTRSFIADVFAQVKAGVPPGKDLNAVYKARRRRCAQVRPLGDLRPLHALRRDALPTTRPPQYRDPRIWTAERDVEMWQALEG
jgi:hypothetical protein